MLGYHCYGQGAREVPRDTKAYIDMYCAKYIPTCQTVERGRRSPPWLACITGIKTSHMMIALRKVGIQELLSSGQPVTLAKNNPQTWYQNPFRK